MHHSQHLVVEERPIGAVQLDPRNSRTHSEAQVDLIVQSMETFGWTNPILVDGEGVIIAGEGRWRAPGNGWVTSTPLVHDGAVYFTDRGTDERSGSLYRYVQA